MFKFICLFTGEACGKSSLRVPYKKGGFEVSGLPGDLSFKRPSAYGTKQVNAIMENADRITFTLCSLPDKRSEISTFKQMQYRSILSKIIDDDKVADCLSHNYKIEEEDLEVHNFDLNEEEFNVITTELRHCFNNDAMSACRKNYEVIRAHWGYVLPVYNTSEAEPYCTGSFTTLVKQKKLKIFNQMIKFLATGSTKTRKNKNILTNY